MEETSDCPLLRFCVHEGSQAAFRSLEARYSGMVYGVAMPRLGRHDLAAEVAQEVVGTRASMQAPVVPATLSL